MNEELKEHFDHSRQLKLLTVHVGDLAFLISLSGVRKIVPADHLNYEDFALQGFVATKTVDDEVFPVVDLNARMNGTPLEPIPATACLILMDRDDAPLALLVSAIGAVRNLSWEDMKQTGVLEGEEQTPGCLGFARFDGKSCEIFDPTDLAAESDRELVRNWRGSRAAIRRLRGLDHSEEIREPVLTDEQAHWAGIYLIVRVADHLIGLRTAEIVEVLPDEGVLPLPDTEENFAGILPLRGRCHPVIDLEAHLGLEGETRTASGALVLMRDGDSTSGLRVAEILGRHRVEGAHIDLADASVPIHRKLYGGCVPYQGQMAALLDTTALFQDRTQSLLAEYRRLQAEEPQALPQELLPMS